VADAPDSSRLIPSTDSSCAGVARGGGGGGGSDGGGGGGGGGEGGGVGGGGGGGSESSLAVVFSELFGVADAPGLDSGAAARAMVQSAA
jgi:hypothetical protein